MRAWLTTVCLIAAVVWFPSAPRAAESRTVSFRTEDGVALAATWFEAAEHPAPAVILLHMLTRSRHDWDLVGQQLAGAGIHALAVDFRGHGDSSPGQTTTGEQGLSQLVLDVKAARTFLTSLTGLVRTSSIGVMGASLGAHIALLEAAGDPEVRSLALLSPGLEYRSLRTEAAMRAYVNRPALLVAGADDPYSRRSIKALAMLGGTALETRVVNGGGHGTIMLARNPDLGTALVDWFLRTLL